MMAQQLPMNSCQDVITMLQVDSSLCDTRTHGHSRHTMESATQCNMELLVKQL
jgi:hypothetical protein